MFDVKKISFISRNESIQHNHALFRLHPEHPIPTCRTLHLFGSLTLVVNVINLYNTVCQINIHNF